MMEKPIQQQKLFQVQHKIGGIWVMKLFNSLQLILPTIIGQLEKVMRYIQVKVKDIKLSFPILKTYDRKSGFQFQQPP